MTNGQSAGKSFAYLLGVYLGDGCVTKGSGNRTVFRLNAIDKDFIEATRAALSNLTDSKILIYDYPAKPGRKPIQHLYCFDEKLCLRLREETDNKKRLPRTEYPIEMIAGIMDSEGFVAANSNPTNRRYYMGYKSCDVWVPEFIKLLQKTGVMIGKVSQENPYREHYQVPTRFTIKMQSWIDSGCYFNIQRKQQRVEKWAESGPYERRARYPRRLTSETNTLDIPGGMKIESELA